MNNFYVYTHHKATDGEVFYVGMGQKNRAYVKQHRSNWWRGVVNKYGYFVRIHTKGLTQEEAEALEVELITRFGRKDRGEGPLVNLCDGGRGSTNPPHKITLEQAAAIIADYSTLSEFRADHRNLFAVTWKNARCNEPGWSELLGTLERKKNLHRTYEDCVAVFKTFKGRSRVDVQREAKAEYVWAVKRGLLEEMYEAAGLSESKTGLRSKEEFLKVARECKYEISALVERDYGLYLAGKKRGWHNEIAWQRKLRKPLTKKYCAALAAECSTRGELKRKDPAAYRKILDNGWWDEIGAHLTVGHTTKPILCVDTGEVFASREAAEQESGYAKAANIFAALKSGGTAGGYRWAYAA